MISSSIPFIIQRVNAVRNEESDVKLRERFILMRLCGQENFITLPYAIACLLSSRVICNYDYLQKMVRVNMIYAKLIRSWTNRASKL